MGSKVRKGQISNNKKMAKLLVPICWPWRNAHNCLRWLLLRAYNYGVKGQRKVEFQTWSNGKIVPKNPSRNLPRALCKGAVSSSSFFLTICFFFHMLYRISTKLGHKHWWVHGYKSYKRFDLKGHVGVNRGQIVKNLPNATCPTNKVLWAPNLVTRTVIPCFI